MDSFLYSYLIVLTYLFTSLTSEDVQEKVQAVVGFSGELPCNVTAEKEGDMLESIAWYRDGSSAAFYSRDFREGGDDAPEGRYRLIATDGQNIDRLQIQSVEMSDEGSYTCVASFLGSPTQKIALTLEVIEPPQRMWVLEYQGGGGGGGTRQVTMAVAGSNASKDIGPYYIGDTLRLLCISYRGKPPPSLTWRSEWRELPQTRDTLSPLRASSNLTYGPLAREDHGRVLTCRAHNHRDAPALAIDLTLDMHLPPELVAVRALGPGATRARAGDELALQCRVLGARPPPALEWRLADTPLHLQQNVTTEASQRLVASTVRLRAAPEHDEAALTCCAPAPARDPGVFVCAPPATLTVTYPPILNISIEAEGVVTSNGTVYVVKGSNITLNCTYKANPPIYQLLWFHEADATHAHPEPEPEPEADGGASVEPVLRLARAAERDAGEYACAAFNDEGPGYSEPVYVDVTYPAYCEDETPAEYGLAEGESLTLRCGVRAHPPPAAYRWLLADGAAAAAADQPSNFTTDVPYIEYKRPDNTTFNKIQCWGLNEVDASELPHTPCTFHVTDETAPRPPARCGAVKGALKDITVTCHKGHDGGLPQKFTFTVISKLNETLTSITSLEPKFMIQEPEQENYRFLITASNNKGDSNVVTIDYENIIDEAAEPTRPPNAVPDITTLSLSLCGGVLLLALAACGLVLCSRERLERADARHLPHPADEPPLCAYNTEESNCETYHDSEDGSDFNVRRTESFRRAVSRYPSQNYDVRRTSSFHSARGEPEPAGRGDDAARHSATCRIHSLQNINRKRDMDALCDHLITEIPSEINYNIPRPMNTFYTMPRKIRQKLPREISDETSEITQTSDGFSLPPPPDEFTSYRAGVRIRDLPPKPAATYTTIVRNSPKHQQRIAVSSVNTIGIPTSDGARESLYTYPDDEYRKPVSNTTNPFGDSS